MELTKVDKQIMFFKKRIEERFERCCKKKLQAIKEKIKNKNNLKKYTKATNELFTKISEITHKGM